MATTLLIIDGDVPFLEAVSDSCRDRGYRVSTASTTTAGVDVAVAVQPNAILLDATIPDDTGWAGLEALGTHPRTRSIPVIIMTRAGAISRPAPCRAIPAGWLEKPFEMSELFEVLDKALGTGLTASQPK